MGTSSYGQTRIWRVSHDDYRYDDMMREALELWKEIEVKSGHKLIFKTGLLWAFPPTNPEFEAVIAAGKGTLLT